MFIKKKKKKNYDKMGNLVRGGIHSPKKNPKYMGVKRHVFC